MRALTAVDLVDLWEQGWESGFAGRAILLLSRTHPEISHEKLEAMSLGVRDDLLLQLRAQLFGSRLESVVSCPKCGDSLEISVDARDLRAEGEASEPPATEWTAGDLWVRFRVPTSGDLHDLEAYRDPQDVRRQLLERCVIEAQRSSQRIEPSQLTPLETSALGERMAHADPQGELTLSADCPTCGHRWESLLDIASFLWRELDIHVRRLLAEVHTLASAYAWSERDILEMSARRRQIYLDELLAR